jgi:hypothetical protein
MHPTGVPFGPETERCGGCAWRYLGGPGPLVPRCRRTAEPGRPGQRIDDAGRACLNWEPPLDCRQCGACCREAYHSVTVSRRDPVYGRHPELIVDRGRYVEIRRAGERCAALAGGPPDGPYGCTIYADRPRPCREFEQGSSNCLDARRRVGLSAL